MSKGLEAFEKIYDSLNDLPYSINDEYLDIVYKHLKALEIIKRCPTQVHRVVNGITIHIWVKSEEEYDLLKEVVL